MEHRTLLHVHYHCHYNVVMQMSCSDNGHYLRLCVGENSVTIVNILWYHCETCNTWTVSD